MEQEKVIGTKNRRSFILYIIALFLLAGVSFFGIIEGYMFSFIGIFICFIADVVLIIRYLRLPEVLVSRNNDDLKVYSRNQYITIPLSSIENIKLKNAHSRYKTYDFGKIIITTTKGERIVVRELDNIDDVKVKILM